MASFFLGGGGGGELYVIKCAWRTVNGTLANIVDPDQTPRKAASDQGRHYLH